jgi:hypothetical protein
LQETIGQLEFDFDHARVVYSYPNGLTVRSLRGKGSYEVSTSKPLFPLTSFQTFQEHWAMFLTGVRNQTANRTSAVHGVLTTEVIEGLYHAASEA